jgi:hypothetical protein
MPRMDDKAFTQLMPKIDVGLNLNKIIEEPYVEKATDDEGTKPNNSNEDNNLATPIVNHIVVKHNLKL